MSIGTVLNQLEWALEFELPNLCEHWNLNHLTQFLKSYSLRSVLSRRFARWRFHFGLVETQSLQTSGTWLDHVFRHVCRLGLFVVLCLFGLWTPSQRSCEEKWRWLRRNLVTFAHFSIFQFYAQNKRSFAKQISSARIWRKKCVFGDAYSAITLKYFIGLEITCYWAHQTMISRYSCFL